MADHYLQWLEWLSSNTVPMPAQHHANKARRATPSTSTGSTRVLLRSLIESAFLRSCSAVSERQIVFPNHIELNKLETFSITFCCPHSVGKRRLTFAR